MLTLPSAAEDPCPSSSSWLMSHYDWGGGSLLFFLVSGYEPEFSKVIWTLSGANSCPVLFIPVYTSYLKDPSQCEDR